MIVKHLTEHHMEFLSLRGGCRGLSKSTLVKMSNCWKSHAAAHLSIFQLLDEFTQVLLQDLQNKDGNVPNPEKLDKQQVSFSFFINNLAGRLAPVLKTIFHQCAISYTCSQSNSDGSA